MDVLSHRIRQLKQVLCGPGAKDDDMVEFLAVQHTQVTAFCDLKIVTDGKFVVPQRDIRRAVFHIVRVPETADDQETDMTVGRHAQRELRQPRAVLIQALASVGPPAAEIDGVFVAAQPLKIFHGLFVGSLHHRGHDDHGDHADDDPQHGKDRACFFAQMEGNAIFKT